jgi:hypothetical protein
MALSQQQVPPAAPVAANLVKATSHPLDLSAPDG